MVEISSKQEVKEEVPAVPGQAPETTDQRDLSLQRISSDSGRLEALGAAGQGILQLEKSAGKSFPALFMFSNLKCRPPG